MVRHRRRYYRAIRVSRELKSAKSVLNLPVRLMPTLYMYCIQSMGRGQEYLLVASPRFSSWKCLHDLFLVVAPAGE